MEPSLAVAPADQVLPLGGGRGPSKWMSRRQRLDRDLWTLETLIPATADVARWLGAAASAGVGARHLFVAGDGDGALVVPRDFALSKLLAGPRRVATALSDKMRRSIATEGWPPPSKALNVAGKRPCERCGERFSRAFVKRGLCVRCESVLREAGRCPFGGGEDGGAIAGGGMSTRTTRTAENSGSTNECGGASVLLEEVVAGISTLDLTKSAKRTARPKRKEDTAVCQAALWCPHLGMCAACETFSCVECRMHQTDGEGVALLVDTLRVSALFVDFDRTMCSTRRGAAPTPTHVADTELCRLAREAPRWDVVAAAAVGDGKEGGESCTDGASTGDEDAQTTHLATGSGAVTTDTDAAPRMCIVTRNSHTADISAWLAALGAQIPVYSVGSRRKQAAVDKSDVILECIASLARGVGGGGGGGVGGGITLFVDDDPRELADPRLVQCKSLHRVRFCTV